MSPAQIMFATMVSLMYRYWQTPIIRQKQRIFTQNKWILSLLHGDSHFGFKIRFSTAWWLVSLRWRHNGLDGVLNHQPHDCLLNSLFGRRSKKTSKFRVTGLCAGNSLGTGEFPAQMASIAENASTWWCHHDVNASMKPWPQTWFELDSFNNKSSSAYVRAEHSLWQPLNNTIHFIYIYIYIYVYLAVWEIKSN